jgi:type IV secretion system protein TrbF
MAKPYDKSIEQQTEAPTTPYLRAKQEWDERIGASRSQAKNWRLCAFFALFLSLLLIVILLFTLTLKQNKVFVAEVSKEGHVVNVTPLNTAYQPNQAQMQYFVTNFVKLVRTIPLDPVVAKQNWLSAYHFLSERGANILNQYFRQDDPASQLGKKTISVNITDVNPISASTYNVHWSETSVDSNGQGLGQKSFSGVFTIALKPPTSEEEILVNPLGIYIIDFHISAWM